MQNLGLNERIQTMFSRDNTFSIASHNQASKIGHPCSRYLYYIRSPRDWEKRTRFAMRTLGVFWQGREAERMVMDLLRRAGYQLTDDQTSFFDETMDLSGRLDCQIVINPNDHPAQRYPVEIKSTQPYIYDKINEAKDFLSFPLEKYYYRNYYYQLNSYLYMRSVEQGFFILYNKADGGIKEIPMMIDWEAANEISEKCAVINRHLELREPPVGICDPDVCTGCEYFSHCNPALDYGGGIDLDVPENALELLNEMEELDPARKRYEQLAEARKGMFKGKVFTVGKYLVSGKYIKRTGYEPDKTKPVSSEYWKISVKNMEGDAE